MSDTAADLDDLRHTDNLEIARELEQDGKDVESLSERATSLERSRCVAYARLVLVAGVVTSSQIENLEVTAITSLLTLKFTRAPAEYTVQVTMGDAKPVVGSVVYRVTERATDFDIEQRALLTDIVTAWPTVDYTVHIAVSGTF